jgi:hypothetical protein
MPRLSKIGAAALAAFGWTLGTSAVTANFLVVAGGGSGGVADDGGGGGGAGGLRSSVSATGGGGSLETALTLNTTLSYTVVVGAGGTGVLGSPYSGQGTNGTASSISTISSVGGGGGGGQVSGILAGLSGGSGGGGGQRPSGNTGGAGTANQGYAGGNGTTAGNDAGGGGGGAGAVGGVASASNDGGNGGVGVANSITGSSTYYGGGGGGGGANSQGSGGNGGGGVALGTNSGGSSGTANTGGGGGASNSHTLYSGNGGSGVVIISYLGAQQFSGGVVTSVGGNTIHTFTTSGTLGPITTLSASYLIVAGGGGAGFNTGGGGGAGGLLSGSGITIDPNSTYLVTVGAGGGGGYDGTNVTRQGLNGSNSSFSMVTTTAVGGGGGATGFPGSGTVGNNGGSGGGGSQGTNSAGGTGTSGQGFAGGTGLSGSQYAGGGGGGAGAVGGAASSSGAIAGNGGVGVTSSISGTSTYYAGGGGGGQGYSGTAGTGGLGGGGNGSNVTNGNGTAGTANTGGGGGGQGAYSGANSGTGGNGGSGVVIISYAGSTQQMAGGTVTIVGGNVIHTFTSTGYLSPIKYSTGSLRFRSSNSAYLTRTATATGNTQKATLSAWVKYATSSTYSVLFTAQNAATTDQDAIYIDNSTQQLVMRIDAAASNPTFYTNMVFRDPAAWYHIVVAIDTTQSVSTDRVKCYVNGNLVTFASYNAPAQNLNFTGWNVSGRRQFVGTQAQYYPAYTWNGEITELNWIDGQQLTPNSFGTFNSYGVWQPITYGGSYGTNGFYLPFNRQAVSYVGSFSGSGQYLSIADSANLRLGSGDFTIEAYINSSWTSTSSTAGIITQYDDAASAGTYIFGIRSSVIYCWDANTNYSGSAIVSNVGWVHVAWVRSGSGTNNNSVYVNGVLNFQFTNTTNFTGAGQPIQIGRWGTTANQYTGYISNLRVVKGTAVYTSNFIPSTSALTAITGTQLLTLQNSSIVDNSTNAYSITNTGGVSTGQTYPFAYGIFQDQGPAGNNWTPSGISGAFGSTLDYLGDAPTLTSATVANYCTWNPNDTGASTMVASNGNLTFTKSGANFAPMRGTIAVIADKYYFEMLANNSSLIQIGVSNGYNIKQNGGDNSISSSGGIGAAWDSRGYLYRTGSGPAYGYTFTTGDVVMVAFDATTGKIWFGKNGTWNTGDPATGTSPAYTASGYDFLTPFANGEGGGSGTTNFGQQPFKYTPPSGFIALNTFNL